MNDSLSNLLPERFDPYAQLLSNILAALAIFIVGWLVSKWARALVLRGLRRSNVDEALARFLSSIAMYSILAGAVLTALNQAGVQATSFIALLGAAGLAVGLALQGNLSHFASGVMILLFRPFTIGHRVTIADLTGKVEEIGLFATTLKTPLNETIIIPNSEITSTSIINFTSAGKYRAVVEVGVGYGSDYRKVEEAITSAALTVEGLDVSEGVDVVFNNFGASSLDLLVLGWCEPDDAAGVRHRMRIAIYEALEQANIEIPFNQLVLHNAPPEE